MQGAATRRTAVQAPPRSITNDRNALIRQKSDVQQRSTATVPPLDTFRTVRMRIDERRRAFLAGDASPLQAGGYSSSPVGSTIAN